MQKRNQYVFTFFRCSCQNRRQDIYYFSVQKENLNGLFAKHNSFTLFSYKIGLIKCLIHRAFKISSSYVIFQNDINKIKNILQKNIYPILLQIIRFFSIFRCFSKFSTLSKAMKTLLITIKRHILNYNIYWGFFKGNIKLNQN